MKNHYKLILVIISVVFVGWANAYSQNIADVEPSDFDTELNTPVFTSKQSESIKHIMSNNAQTLIEQGYNVELMRDDQVIAITIPLDKLFKPNQTSLISSSTPLLQPFVNYTHHYGKYKLLLAVHSDDTGSQYYKETLCEQRIIALYDFFDRYGSTPAMVYGYPLTDTQPLYNNDSRLNRALNRRLEIYIIPGPKLLPNGITKRQ